jgi:hypothetical protein
VIGKSGPCAGPVFRLHWGIRNSDWMPASNKTYPANRYNFNRIDKEGGQ